MPSVCFYFQVHQPYRLRRYTYFDVGHAHEYFDEHKNQQILRKVAGKCYLPMNRLLLDLIRRHRGAFRIAFSISGVALEQFARWAPDVLESFQELYATGCVELLSETWGHALSALYDEEDFFEQITLHRTLIKKYFDAETRVFRNTELIYSDTIGRLIERAGFRAAIAEGCDDILGWRSPNFVYRHPESSLALLLKNYRLSDDIAFRFSNRAWEHWPLNAETYVRWLTELDGNAETVNLFMDYETFGEHQWEESGIFDFMRAFPGYLSAHPQWNFATPSEVIGRNVPKDALPVSRTTSWADAERDTTAWNGNQMQRAALQRMYALAPLIRASNDAAMVETWRKLLTSDHYYYMCTKWFADGDVHAYFSPFPSPYEAFMNFMNCLTDFERRVTNSTGKDAPVSSRR